MRSNKLPIILIGTLSLVVLIALVYASFTGQINVTGTTAVRDSKWEIKITNISEAITTGTAKEIQTPTIDNDYPTTINDYQVSLTTPGDSISYEIEVTNDGDYDATLTDYTINTTPICKVGNNEEAKSAQDVCENLEYKITYKGGSLLQKNVDILKSKDKVTFVITLTYKEFNDSTKLPTENVSISSLGISLEYSQRGAANVNKDGITIKKYVYNIGDEITVNNELYYVIADSPRNQDYVTALKANPLTVDEVNANKIGSDGINHVNRYTYESVWEAMDNSGYGGMAYYSSPTCGFATLGGSYSHSGCASDNANSYDTSDVKYVVDKWASMTFSNNELSTGSNDYQARLLTKDELVNNLGCTANDCRNSSYNWTYNSNYWYWTMTPYADSNVWYVAPGGNLHNNAVYYDSGIRPVINVYKSAIQSQ